MDTRRYISYLLLLILGLVWQHTPLKAALSSDYGLPNIINYSKSNYQGGNQNWVIQQDSKGLIYVGNNMGTLVFDGVRWSIIPMPNYSVVRALIPIGTHGILAAAFDEFGLIHPDSLGNYTYTSWRNRLPADIVEIGDIWKIHKAEDHLYLQSRKYLICISSKGDYLWHNEAETEFIFSFLPADDLLVQELNRGFLWVSKDSVSRLPIDNRLNTIPVWDIISLPDQSLMFFTQNEGAWIWKEQNITPWSGLVNQQLIDHGFYSLAFEEGKLFLGTIQHGLIITDLKGNDYVEVTKLNGLQNNTILSQFIDRDKNLWLGLDNGIDLFEIGAPVNYIGKNGQYGTGYTSLLYGDRLYLGTNQGVYRQTGENRGDFEMIGALRGQVWSLGVADRDILCAHHKGIYAISEQRTDPIFSGTGCWMYLQVPWKSDYYFVGSYSGIILISHRAGRWTYEKTLEGFDESSRVMCFDDEQSLWVSHGYKGIFRLQIDTATLELKEVEFFGKDSGLPSEVNNEIFCVNGNIYAATISGIYRFNYSDRQFKEASKWNHYLGDYSRVSRIFENETNNWFLFQDGILGNLRLLNDSIFLYDRQVAPYLTGKYVPAFEHVTIINNEEFLVGIEEGFAYVNRSSGNPDAELNAFFVQIQIIASQQHRETTVQLPFDPDQKHISVERKIPWTYNNIMLRYALPRYGTANQLELNFELNGDRWAAEPYQGELLLTNLREGRYLLKMYLQDTRTEQKVIRELEFIISPPWYRHTLFYIALLMVLFLTGLSVYYVLNRRIQGERRRELILQQRKMIQREIKLKQKSMLTEQELTRMRNDKLHAEIVHKSKELANSTMNIIHKNQILTDLKNDLIEISSRGDLPKSEARRFVRKIDRELSDDQSWTLFETHFDRVHENFFQRLRQKHADLTPRDLRMCAFLRMNLSSKEIAPLQNISIRSVEISRYRLRKKLGLEHETNLTDYIMNI